MQEAHAGAYKKNMGYDQCIVEAVQVCFCVFDIFADMLRMLQDVMPEM